MRKLNMKLLSLMISALTLSSSAFAANCATYFGTRAYVAQKGNELVIQFAGGPYSNNVLTANGESGGSYYFRDTATAATAIVNKAVLSGGAGNVYYSWGEGFGRGQDKGSVTLYCK